MQVQSVQNQPNFQGRFTFIGAQMEMTRNFEKLYPDFSKFIRRKPYDINISHKIEQYTENDSCLITEFVATNKRFYTKSKQKKVLKVLAEIYDDIDRKIHHSKKTYIEIVEHLTESMDKKLGIEHTPYKNKTY